MSSITHATHATSALFYLCYVSAELPMLRQLCITHATSALHYPCNAVLTVCVSAGEEYPPYEATWFRKASDEQTNGIMYVYKGGYWEAKEKADWSRCPDIF